MVVVVRGVGWGDVCGYCLLGDIDFTPLINTAGSHAAALSPIINRFLNRVVCLVLKNVLCGSVNAFRVIHCLSTSVLSEEEFPLCCQAFFFLKC